MSNVCRKASCQTGVLVRLHNLIPTSAKLHSVKFAILPYVAYRQTVWHFCRSSDAKKLERIQKRALRAVYCDHKSIFSKGETTNTSYATTTSIAIIMCKVKMVWCPALYSVDLLVFTNSQYHLLISPYPDFGLINAYRKQSLAYLGPSLTPNSTDLFDRLNH